MPRPIYIICSESILVEKEGFVTYVRVFDKAMVSRIPATSPPPQDMKNPKAGLSFVLSSAWMRDTDDPSIQYEFEVCFRLGDKNDVVAHGQFSFTSPFHLIRINGQIGGFPSMGIMEMECRVRPVGGQDWQLQSYPLIVEEFPVSAQSPSGTESVTSSIAPAPPSAPPR